MHSSMETVICAHCGKSYSIQTPLNIHVQLMLSKQAELEACPLCRNGSRKVVVHIGVTDTLNF